MKLSQISYQRVYPLGSYSTERIGLEATLDEGENPETALSHLKILVEELHQETLKSLPTDDFRGTHVRNVVEEPVDKIQSWKTVISMCTSIKALERFKPQVDRENNQELTEAYNNKLQSLKNGQDSFKDISNRF